MTIGELKKAIAPLDDGLEIEIVARYEDEDGDEVECSLDLESVGAVLDPDTARQYARFECADLE
jgi:hypothetical protein